MMFAIKRIIRSYFYLLKLKSKSVLLRNTQNKNLRFSSRNKYQKFEHMNKATLAARLQLQEEKREFLYSIIALVMKIGLVAIFGGSFFRLAIASHQRVMRQLEISSILDLETKKLNELSYRFDRLFSIGGRNRLIDEQEHWIAPNSFRVIWK